jgi:molecular chaperone GrpE
MVSQNEIQNKFFDNEVDTESSPSIDDFIRELEAKERDLHISFESVVALDSDPDEVYAVEPIVEKEENTAVHLKSGAAHRDSRPGAKSQSDANKAAVKKDHNELVDSIRRLQNDFINFRKRTERERQETFRNQICDLATRMLPVLDNLNRALAAAGNVEGKPNDFVRFLQGITLVNKQLNDVLGEMGLEEIRSVGMPFDPELHEAVAIEESKEHPANTVLFEMLRGYRIEDRVIRHAMVRVSANSNASTSANEPNDDRITFET